MISTTKEEAALIEAAVDKVMENLAGHEVRTVYTRYCDNDLLIDAEGILSETEKHLIRTNNLEALNSLNNLFRESAPQAVKQLNALLNDHYKVFLIDDNTDLLKDQVSYRLRFPENH